MKLYAVEFTDGTVRYVAAHTMEDALMDQSLDRDRDNIRTVTAVSRMLTMVQYN